MDIRDVGALIYIQEKLGGSIKKRSGSKANRYRLHHKIGVISLVNRINGYIRNPNRLLQLSKVCDIYNIKLEMPGPLSYNSGWLSGMIDSEGSVYLNLASKQIIISVAQKNKYLLDEIQLVYGGKVYVNSKGNLNFKYTMYRKNEILDLLDNYLLKKNPLRSAKKNRLLLIKEIYPLLSYNVKNIDNYKKLMELLMKWEIYKK